MKNRDIVLAVLIKRGRMTAREIAEATGIEEGNAQYHLRTLKQMEQVFVAAWIVIPACRDIRVWEAGNEADAPKPNGEARFNKSITKRAPQPRSKMSPESIVRLQEEFLEREDAKRRKRLLDDIKPFRDPMIFMTAGVRP